MAKHEVIIRENTSATKTEAPYLPQYVKKSDLAFAAVCSQVAAEAGLTETQVRAIFEGAFAEFETLEKDAAVRIHMDGMTVYLAIYGSFSTSDAEFDPAKNTLEIAISLDDDIKYALANVTPTIVTDETATKVRVTGVADCEDERPYDVIYGLRMFNVQGVNLVLDDEGAEIYLEDSAGTKYPCSYKSSTSTKQVVNTYLKTLLEAGDYKLVVKSRGGDAEGSLQTAFRRVKYIKAEPIVTGVEVEDWTLTEGGETNAIVGNNIPNVGFSNDGSESDNTLKGFYTDPGSGDEVSVRIGPFMKPTQSKKLIFQPTYFLRAMTGVESGVQCAARVELWCGQTKYCDVPFTVTKG